MSTHSKVSAAKLIFQPCMVKQLGTAKVDKKCAKQDLTPTPQLKQRLEWLAENPALGKSRDDVKEGYISFPEGRHVIFYRMAEGCIEVIGIVHQSEDIDTHLSD